jgi:hypothetical protein
LAKPKITDKPIWNQYESRIIELFISALKLLRKEVLTNMHVEDEISQRLYICLRRANFELNKQDRGLDNQPFFNTPIQPYSENVILNPPKPDFQCQLNDKYAINDEESVLYYHIECKRLGFPTSPSWRLNTNYVVNGICRFIQKKHSYGLNCKSGLMIGYIQNMTYNEIFYEVNLENNNHAIPIMNLFVDNWDSAGLNTLEHQFDREIEITPFTLFHLWVDLRNNN